MTETFAEAKQKFLRNTRKSRWRYGDTPEGFFYSSSRAAFATRKYPVFGTADKAAKDKFKAMAHKAMDDIIKAEGYGQRVVPETSHCRTIEKLAGDLSREEKDILDKGRFRIGVTQKLFNLYLKYLWAKGKILSPPHCPFDARIIYSQKGSLWRYMANKKAEHRWTLSDEPSHYQAWVAAAERAADAGEFASIAEWELITYNKELLQ